MINKPTTAIHRPGVVANPHPSRPVVSAPRMACLVIIRDLQQKSHASVAQPIPDDKGIPDVGCGTSDVVR